MASLFGVRRQAVEQWRERGVPAAFSCLALTAIVDLLSHRLKPARTADSACST